MFKFLPEYFIWHYGMALGNIFRIQQDYLWFIYNLFSLPVLTKTFFAPFFRIHEPYNKNLSFEMLMQNFVANMVARVVGMILRTIMITIGVISLGITALSIIPVLLGWLSFPALIPFLLVTGVTFLF